MVWAVLLGDWVSHRSVQSGYRCNVTPITSAFWMTGLHISHVWPQAASLIFPGAHDEHDSFLCATAFWDIMPHSKGLQIAACFHTAHGLQMVSGGVKSEPKWLTRDCWGGFGVWGYETVFMLTWTSGIRQWLRDNRRGYLKSGSWATLRAPYSLIWNVRLQCCLKEDRKRATSPHQRGTDKGWEGQETRNECFRAWSVLLHRNTRISYLHTCRRLCWWRASCTGCRRWDPQSRWNWKRARSHSSCPSPSL